LNGTASRKRETRSGCFVSEGCSLSPAAVGMVSICRPWRTQAWHIDRGRMMLFVTGKGHKDRYTILSARAPALLGDHWRQNGPFEYCFHGRDKSRPMAVGTAQAIYYQALKRCGVRHVGGIHVLRHCFATFLMEAGKDIYTIKRWMGRGALDTTGRYMHVRAEHLRKVKSPLDTLYDED
jgi:integrase/recombinase XerD